MTSPFENLDSKKQSRILDAALKEFAEKGYEDASTNQIVKEAGIGKRMLFYYFKNKKELYLYLINYSIDIVIHEYLNLIGTGERDFIKRWKQIAQVKMKYYHDNPNVSNFISMVYVNEAFELPMDIQEQLTELASLGYKRMFDNIDKTLFRSDIDVEKAFQLIRWAIEGYQNELVNKLKGKNITLVDLNPYWNEFYEYLSILRTSFYHHSYEEKVPTD